MKCFFKARGMSQTLKTFHVQHGNYFLKLTPVCGSFFLTKGEPLIFKFSHVQHELLFMTSCARKDFIAQQYKRSETLLGLNWQQFKSKKLLHTSYIFIVRLSSAPLKAPFAVCSIWVLPLQRKQSLSCKNKPRRD